MDLQLFIPIIIVLLFIVVVFASVKVVPQASEYIVERFCRYHKTLNPGLNLVVPLMDRVRSRVSMKETVLNVRQQEVISRDNASVQVDGVAFFQVLDAKKVTYVINDLAFALENLIMTNIRTVMRGLI